MEIQRKSSHAGYKRTFKNHYEHSLIDGIMTITKNRIHCKGTMGDGKFLKIKIRANKKKTNYH